MHELISLRLSPSSSDIVVSSSGDRETFSFWPEGRGE